MKKVIVIGCPGSGKSTFSKKLHGITGLPLYHLDLMNWNADRTTVPKQVFLKRLENAITKDLWIIDGNYGSTLELRLNACDTVFFLDYPQEVCLEGISARRGKLRSDMPWVEAADEVDEEFLVFVKSYNCVSRPIVLELLQKYPDKTVHVFRSRREGEEYLSGL